jgi:hypothetical protein
MRYLDKIVENESLKNLHVDARAAIDVTAAPLKPIDTRVVEICKQLEIHFLVAFLARWVSHTEYVSVKSCTIHVDVPPR